MTVSFVAHASAVTVGTPPQTSGSFTPATNGNQLIIFTLDATGSGTSVTGTGTYSLITPPGFNNDTDGDEFGVFSNPSASAVPQTFTVGGTTFCGGIQIEYTGVGSITNGVYNNRTAIASGSNILGSPVVVPTGSKLVVLFISGTSITKAITPTAGTSRWSNPTAGTGSFNIVEYPGTGSSITPTATSTETSGDFSIIQLILNPPPPGGMVSVDVAAASPTYGGHGTSPYSFNIAIGSSATGILVLEGNQDGTPSTASGVTCGGVAMENIGTVTVGLFESSAWWLQSPPTGTQSITVTMNTAVLFQGAVAISFNNATGFGSVVTNGNAGTQTPVVTGIGAGSSGIYAASTHAFCTNIASSGANQTTQATIIDIDGATSISGDTIPGVDAGAFSWTESGTTFNGWTAIAVAVLGSSGSPSGNPLRRFKRTNIFVPYPR